MGAATVGGPAEESRRQRRFDVADGAFVDEHGRALVFAVAPTKIYAYDRDGLGGATRYRG
ncbi:MAG: hypothetical protein ACT4RN_18875 [Pseudonocardia sp.]